MDLQAAESELIKRPKLRWLAREKESGRIYDWATIASGMILAATLSLSYWMLSRAGQPGTMLTPPQTEAVVSPPPDEDPGEQTLSLSGLTPPKA